MFLTWLKDELAKLPINDLPGPTDKLEDGEEVFGTIKNLDTRRLFYIHQSCSQALSAFKHQSSHECLDLRLQLERGEKEAKKAGARLDAIASELNILTMRERSAADLFSTMMYEELGPGLISKCRDGALPDLRENWQVILVPPIIGGMRIMIARPR